ncbi:MAG: hypothetical protein ACLP1D_25185 [Xanthobacteraceae bacterium]
MGRQDNPIRHPILRHALNALRALVLLGIAGAASGCAGGNPGPAQGPMAAMASIPGEGRTVAFESIDGPPPQVFERFVQVLDAESQLRNVAVVSRSAPASYHVRGYLSAQVHGNRTSIAWVWDVYDRDQQRVLRLSGEEDGGRATGRDAWTVADTALLRRIAQSGLISLSGFVNGTAPPDLPPAGRAGPAIASLSTGSTTPAGAALGFSAQ